MGALRYFPIPELTDDNLARFWDKVDVQGSDKCWEWIAGGDKNGYGFFYLDGISYRANRISYTLVNEDPGKLCVCHECDNPACVNPTHLWIGTQQDNVDDCTQKGRRANLCGEEISTAKLTKKQVKEILGSTESQQILADRFGIAYQTVSKSQLGDRWGIF